MKSNRSSLLVIGLFVLLYILPLGARPMVIPDESRYAEIPREMLASGNWITPRLDGLRYFEKPVLGYWLGASSMLVFGQNMFAARLPSALAAGFSALLVLYLLSNSGIRGRDSFIPPVVFLTFAQVFMTGVFTVLDGPFSFFLTATMVLFFLASEAEGRERCLRYAACGAAAGCAFLTKGFLAFAVPGVALLPYLLWRKKLLEFLKYSWIPLIAMLVVVLPWALLIHSLEGDYWNYFFWEEHVQRFASSSKAQHAKPFWFYLPILILGALPWSFVAPGLMKGRLSLPVQPLYRFALCWFVFPFLLLSIAQGKLQTYILPCFAPLSVFIGAGISKYIETGERNRGVKIGLLIPGVLFLLVAVALPVDFFAHFANQVLFIPAEWWKMALLSAGFAAFGTLCISAARAGTCSRQMIMTALSPVFVFLVVHFAVPEHVKGAHTPEYFFSRHAGDISADSFLVTNERLLHAVCWNFKRSDVYLFGKQGELDYGLQFEPSRMFSAERLKSLIEDPLRTQPVTLLIHTKTLREFGQGLPQPKRKEGDANYTLAVY